MHGLTERRATAADTAIAVDIHARAFRAYVQALGRSASSAPDWVPGEIEAGNVWVYAQGGKVVAASLQKVDPEAGTATIDSIAVDPKCQSQGIGSRIITLIEARLRAEGIRTLTLHTAAIAKRLVAFYKRHGFRVVRIGPRDRNPDGFDRVYFEKTL